MNTMICVNLPSEWHQTSLTCGTHCWGRHWTPRTGPRCPRSWQSSPPSPWVAPAPLQSTGSQLSSPGPQSLWRAEMLYVFIHWDIFTLQACCFLFLQTKHVSREYQAETDVSCPVLTSNSLKVMPLMWGFLSFLGMTGSPSPPSVGISRVCSSAEAMAVSGGGVGDLGVINEDVLATSSSGGGWSWSSTSSLMQLSATEEASSTLSATWPGSGVLSIILGFSSNETRFSDLTLPRRLSEDRWLLRMEWVGELLGDLWCSHWELSLAPDLVNSPAPESLLRKLGWPAASAVTGGVGRQLFISQAGGWGAAALSPLWRAAADWLSSWSETAARCRALPPLVSASLLMHPSY